MDEQPGTENLRKVEDLGAELREAGRRIADMKAMLRAVRDWIDHELKKEGGSDT